MRDDTVAARLESVDAVFLASGEAGDVACLIYAFCRIILPSNVAWLRFITLNVRPADREAHEPLYPIGVEGAFLAILHNFPKITLAPIFPCILVTKLTRRGPR